MVKKANYIIFHPERQRQSTLVNAIALVNKRTISNWTGNIYVDRIGNRNEDPFVFNNPWLYSYCHASQLRRNRRKDCFLQEGSVIIFASGQCADEGILSVDTVFLIGKVHNWIPKPNLQLPAQFKKNFQNNSSALWTRHFQFPFRKSHDSVTHTYSAELWQVGKTNFSFLPLNDEGERASILIKGMGAHLSNKISKKVKGKYPILLSDSEIQLVIKTIDKVTKTKVLRNIKMTIPAVTNRKVKHC